MPKPKDKLAFFFSFSQKKSPALLVLSYPLLSFLFLPFQSFLPFLKNNVPPFRLRALSSFLNKRPPFLSRKSLGVACLFSPWFVLTDCYLPLLLVKISDFMPLTAAKSPKNRKRKAQKKWDLGIPSSCAWGWVGMPDSCGRNCGTSKMHDCWYGGAWSKAARLVSIVPYFRVWEQRLSVWDEETRTMASGEAYHVDEQAVC